MSRQVTWTRALLEHEKALLRKQMGETLERVGPRAVARYLGERIAAFDGDFTPEIQARRFVYIMGLIAWHEHEQCLSDSQLNGLFETAEAILRVQRIPPESSKLSFLHGELRLLRSQLQRKEGRFFESTWEALLAKTVSGRSQVDAGRLALAIALRASRRGETRIALPAFAEAEAQAADDATRERAQLSRIQLLRLAGRWEEAEEFAKYLVSHAALSNAGLMELIWEQLCRQACLSGDFLQVVLAASRNGTHRQSSYVIESTLWVKACSSKAWLERVPQVLSIRRSFPDLIRRGASNGRFYEVALRLDRCYDQEIPFVLRLDELGGALAEASRLPTLDKELLTWAAAARWLVRNKQVAHAELVLSEYCALSRRVTMGASDDALGLMQDLIVGYQRHELVPEEAPGRAG